MTFFTTHSSVNENSVPESNPMLSPLHMYLSGSAFLVSSTDPNKQLFNVRSVFNLLTRDLVQKKYIDLLLFQG